MSDTPKSAPKSPKSPDGDRIAKVLARAGVASRRDAEKMIAEGRVAVNGKVIDSPALNVTQKDKIEVDGAPLAEAEPARLWLYHKPLGLVTSARDEKGRDTVFDKLPEDMPRVMSVGRLDLNSEGLLLLTNDGEVKRKLELPSTGWVRKYRVRVNGRPDDATLEPLRKGVTVDGERFQEMSVTIDRQQGANAWLTVGLREGKNREIRRAMEAVGLNVNRLIRISYGPFRLGELKPGAVEEVKARVLRDQLGLSAEPDEAPKRTVERSRKPGAKGLGKPGGKPGGRRPFAARDSFGEGTTRERRGPGKDPAGKGPQDKGPAGKGGAGERPASSSRGKPAAGPNGRSSGRPGGRPGGKPGGPGGRPGPKPGSKPGPKR
ncbi:pseudouridine synthase [Maritimibacter sp. DP1N21-5]|uniref:pseudouridine synthase n=1 Tax=Maritimibacter sp. DP1N21-5 TaxID=2836867 RepID=UPI001C46EFD7|nr:pseudouridine synthase [Maritimibacter sp. DP1N21-5]MBV7409129.1 rRNA pseudouridine synthase [Maritimibacter sp. DP1N21-5]